MPESEPKIDKKDRLALVGAKIEADILAESSPQLLLSETERLELRQSLIENGVNFQPFLVGKAYHPESHEYLEQKKGTHGSKLIMVTASLSRDKYESLLKNTLEQAISQPGGAVAKGNEDKPSTEEVLAFAQHYLNEQLGRTTPPRFAPRTQAAQLQQETNPEVSPQWGENVIYRIEAITASAYVILRTLAIEDPEEAAKFQTGDVANKQLRERVIRGKARSFAKDDPQRGQWEARQTDEKNIRHLPVNTLTTLTKSLVSWPEV